MRTWMLMLAGCSLAACGGCGGGGTAVVYGKLVRAADGSPAGEGRVTVGDTSVKANEGGFFAVVVPADTKLRMSVDAKGFAPSQKVFEAPAQASSFVQVALQPWEAETSFTVAAGGSLSVGQTQLTFPPGALEGAGTVSVKLSTIDPSDALERAAVPGGFETTTGQMLESLGAIAVQVSGPDGGDVQLKAGQAARLVLETSGASSSAATVPLWSYDELAGAWEQEGQLTQCAAGLCQADLPHLSWWGAGQVYETSCLLACVKDGSGGAAPGVQLEAKGVDYNGNSLGVTGADGCACLEVRKGSRVDVVGVTTSGASGAVTVSTASAASTCSSAPSSCATLPSPLKVETPKFQAILSWAESPADLDAHLTGPCVGAGCDGERFHVYFGAKGSVVEAPFASLDTDDTSGFGPEIISLGRCASGTYRYSVNRFSGSPGLEQANAKVLLLLPGGQTRERAAPAANPTMADVWIVGDLTCDASCACTWADRDLYGGIELIDP